MKLVGIVAIISTLVCQGCSVQEISTNIKKKHPGILQKNGNPFSYKLPATPMQNPFSYKLPATNMRNPFSYKLPATPMQNPFSYKLPAPK